MILSSPFSRQNRAHQSWTMAPSSSQQHSHFRSHSLRRPAPREPAPKPAGPHAPSTLDRLPFQRSRSAGPSQRRVQSSLANHAPQANGTLKQPAYLPADRQIKQQQQQQIYAPASIASPSEYRSVAANGDSQHYAATSYRGNQSSAASESGRSGRESALGQLWDRFGTLRLRSRFGRRKAASLAGEPDGDRPQVRPLVLDPEVYAKRQVEAEAIYAEGSQAIDNNLRRRLVEHQISESLMAEGELRTLVEEESQVQPDYRELVGSLTNWINDELAQQRIIVKDLQDDLHDGQILVKLIEKLHQIKIDIVEVTQNELTQRHKLRLVLDTINRILALQARWARVRWTVEGIHSKNMVEIIHLLVTLTIYYRAPVKLPADVRVRVVEVQKSRGRLVRRSHEVQLTDSAQLAQAADQLAEPNQKRDAFDALLEFAPDKLVDVKQALAKFVNRHLNKIQMSCLSNRVHEVLDPEQFSDGLLLVFLIASLEDYFVPLGNLFTAAPTPQQESPSADMTSVLQQNGASQISYTGMIQTALEPDSFINTQPIQKLHNVNLAFQLMHEAGIPIRERVRAEAIVNGDLKSVLRVLYALFSRYRHL